MTKFAMGALALIVTGAACALETDVPLAGETGAAATTGAGGTSGAGGSTTGKTSSTSTATAGPMTTTGATSTTTAAGAGGTGAGGSGSGGPGGASGAGGSNDPQDASTDVNGAPDSPGAGGHDAGVTPEGGSGGSAGAGGAPPLRYGWYEAESAPPNQLYGRAVKSKCGATCPSMDGIKPGDNCCSAGGQVNWIVSGGKGPDPQPPDGRGGGELRFNGIAVPADGMYDVTWWYHCGNDDNFGDKNCGGQTDPPTLSSGCRPHQIVVNGTEMTGTYHFPCFSGSWGIIRAATTTLPLKAGNTNWVHVYATKPRDAADMDALEIRPAGKGVAPLIKSNSDPIGH